MINNDDKIFLIFISILLLLIIFPVSIMWASETFFTHPIPYTWWNVLGIDCVFGLLLWIKIQNEKK